MSLIPDIAALQKTFDALPLATFQAGETVLAAGSRTGRLLILKQGAVAIVKDGIQLARVAEPGAVFGELATLLDQPHTCGRAGPGNVAVSRRRRGCPACTRPDYASLRCCSGAASSRRQPSLH